MILIWILNVKDKTRNPKLTKDGLNFSIKCSSFFERFLDRMWVIAMSKILNKTEYQWRIFKMLKLSIEFNLLYFKLICVNRLHYSSSVSGFTITCGSSPSKINPKNIKLSVFFCSSKGRILKMLTLSTVI